MEAQSEPTNPLWPFPFTPQDWEQTPLAVQAYVHTLRDEVTQLRDACGDTGGAASAEFHDLIPATVIGLAVQEALPAHHRCHAPQSGWETGASGPSPGALTPYDRTRGAGPSGVRVRQHDVCRYQALLYASGA